MGAIWDRRVVLYYDNRGIYWMLKDSYRSPVLELPYDQIDLYLEQQTKSYVDMTQDLLAGDMLDEEQFTASVKLSFDRKVADMRKHGNGD